MSGLLHPEPSASMPSGGGFEDNGHPLSPRERETLALLSVQRAQSIGLAHAKALFERHYEPVLDIRLLTGERDENFYVRTAGGEESILKIFGSSRDEEAAALLVATLSYLELTAPDIPAPRLRLNNRGATLVRFRDVEAHDRLAILYSYLPGTPLIDARRHSEQRRQCGRLLARLAQALSSFDHPAMHRPLIWDLNNVPVLRAVIPQIPDLPFAPFLVSFVDHFTQNVAESLARLPHQFVHNDFNARNIIVEPVGNQSVSAVIDFGDAAYTARVADVAVGVIGQLSSPETALTSMNEFVSAYQSIESLRPDEQEILPLLVTARIVQNFVLTCWYRSRVPDGAHFASFDTDYFSWRINFAKNLLNWSNAS